MNLIDLIRRNSKSLSLPDGAHQIRWPWGGASWRAVAIPNQADAELRLTDFVDAHPVWTRPDSLGWHAAAKDKTTLEIIFKRGDETLSRHVMPVGPAPAPILLPWPHPAEPLGSDVALVLRPVGGRASEVAVLVHRALSRQHLYDRATGDGVEIGPGAAPQIHASDTVRVVYVEETPPEKWAALYDKGDRFQARSFDWSAVRVGTANALPVEDASQDFIFSSHVFEHLANPLGHLEHWRAKLKPGGVVLAVAPDMASTSDRMMRPSTLEEIQDEYASGLRTPQARHYERFAARASGGRNPTIEHARKMRERGESIHVHFYDRAAIARVLQAAVDQLGYRGFQLTHARNHKDFHFCLTT